MRVEEEMISVEQREQIRRAYFLEHKSMRQIARELGHSRETVVKCRPHVYHLQSAGVYHP